MAILFAAGFEHNNLQYAEFDYFTNGTVIVSTDLNGLSSSIAGTYVMRLTGNNAYQYWYINKDQSSESEIYISLWHDIGTATSGKFQFVDSGGTVQCTLNKGGGSAAWAFYRGDNSTLLASGSINEDTWQLLEAHIVFSDSVGVIQTKVNGVTDIDQSGLDTLQTGAIPNHWGWRMYGTSLFSRLDNIVVGDAAQGWIGDCRVKQLLPTADTAQADFTPQGAGDNYVEVDNVAIAGGDSTYNTSSTDAHKDLFDITDYDGTDLTPLTVIHHLRARQDLPGARVYPIISSNGTERQGDLRNLGSSYSNYIDIHNTNPDGDIAWTDGAIDALQIGYEAEIA